MPPRAIAPPPKAVAPRAVAAGPTLAAANSRTEARPILTTTKEWVVPPRPKPGRKPAEAVPESSRKALNRASQRAFRDRKQEHVADLEAKVRLLEQGEGERSSFFQSMARTAKEEVTAMRAENDSLRSQLAALQAEKVRGERFGEVEERSRVRREPPRSEEDDLPSKRARRASTRLPDKVVLTYQEDSPSPSSSPVTAFAAVSPPPEERAASPGEPSCGLCASPESCFCSEQGYHIDHSKATTSSIAIPLRPRLATGRTPVWRLDSSGPSSAPSPKPATCSGDPSTCPACQDDPFGQAFCQSLSNSVCSSNPCATCPSRASTSTLVAFTSNPLPPSAAPTMMDDDGLFDSLADLPCCGDPQLCGSLSCGPKVEPFEETLPRSVLPGVRETVPCNEAWTVLKCHPNIAFADLQMLADVVAKRTRCDGPVDVPLPSAPSTSRLSTPPLGLGILSTDPRMPELAPEHALVCAQEAGQRKRLTVERGAVNEALSILDRSVGGFLRR